jgi:hypothetical protein
MTVVPTEGSVMRFRSYLIGLGVVVSTLVFSLVSTAIAQPNVPATTVQLPSFSVFTVQTTVSVPDSGGAYLGGLNSGASNSSRFGIGPFRNRGLSSTRAASGMSLSATIIDHDEIDRALLAEAAATHVSADAAAVKIDTKAAAIAKSIKPEPSSVALSPAERSSATSGGMLPGSVAAIREQHAAAADLQTAELAGYLTKARQAEADNKPGVAKVFYQMVARRDTGRMKQEAMDRLAVLTSARR